MNLQRHHHSPPIIGHLRAIPLFVGCSNRELQEIAGLTTEVAVPTGKVLCRQGQAGREAFLILDGEACAEANGTELARLGPGAVCGELALLDGGARSATVTAATPMRLLAMSVSDFADLSSRPSVARGVLVTLAGRLRSTNGKS